MKTPWTRTFLLAWAFVLLTAPEGSAQTWAGWTDRSVELRTDRMDFGAPGGGNENYYDGDFADFDMDGRMDRAFISRFGLVWNTGGGVLFPVSVQRVDEGTGQASPQPPSHNLPNLVGLGFGDGYAGNDGVQWADIDGDGDPDSIQGGNGEPFVFQANRSGRFWEVGRRSGSALNIANTDIDLDGDVDLAVAHAFCSNRDCGGPVDFRLWVNDGGGNFSDETSARGLGQFRPNRVVGVVSGDVDGDGDFDLVLLDGARITVAVAYNDGSGNFTEQLFAFNRSLAELAVIGSGFSQSPNLGDIDDDGDLDLVLAMANGVDSDVTIVPVSDHDVVSHVIMINDGAGNFTEESSLRWDDAGSPDVLMGGNGKLVDADFDGDLDFVAFHKPGPVFFQLFLNDGGGYFTYRPDLDPGTWAAFDKLGVDVDVSDIDADGTYDLWVGIAKLKPNILINSYRTPSAIRADLPRSARLIAADATGVTLAWEHPPWAAVNRHYKVLRGTAVDAEPRDRPVLHVVALSPHEDDSFAAPLTRFTRTEDLGDASVVLDGSRERVTFTDSTAVPGVTYRYSIVHVGTERNASVPSWEVEAVVPDPDPSAPDVEGPELMIVSPTFEEWSTHPRVVLDFADGRSGLDLSSLEVFFDVPLGTGDPRSGGRPADANLADLSWRKDDGTYVYRLEESLALPVGLARLTARVADMAGNSTERTLLFDVRNPFGLSTDEVTYPTADFFATSRAGSQVVDFDGNASADTDGIIMRWEWSFGDGLTGIGRDASHRYRDPGDYRVRLIVRDNEGLVAVASRDVTVLPADPDGDGDGIADSGELDAGTDPDRPDTDGDGIDDGADCSPLDANAAVDPDEVADLRVLRAAGTITVTWRDDRALFAPDASHDVLAGDLAELPALGLDAAGACVTQALESDRLVDAPAGWIGTFYLTRLRNGCGFGAWGADSFSADRVATACDAP